MVEGAVAIVTGGLGGIGRVYVKTLLQEAAKGVAIWDVAEEGAQDFLKQLEEEFGSGKAIFVKVDLCHTKAIEDAFESTVKCFNQLDILINNAGVANDNIEETVQVNLTAVLFATTLATTKYFPKYAKIKVPIVVNTASALGLAITDCALSYSATKHALVAYGRCLGIASNSPENNFRILTICPTITDTGLANYFKSHEGPRKEMLKKQMQSPEALGPCLQKVLKDGKSGSVWLISKGGTREVHFKEANDEMRQQLHDSGACISCDHNITKS